MENVVLAVSLDIMDSVFAVLALGLMSSSLVVLTAGALVSGFRALISMVTGHSPVWGGA